MRRYPADIPTAYEADWGQEWTHLMLTYIIQARTPAAHRNVGAEELQCAAVNWEPCDHWAENP